MHYTRAPSKREPFLSEKEQIDSFPQGMTLTAGRPRLDQVLNNAISRTIRGSGREKLSGLVVGVCGPLALADEMVTAVNGVNSQMRDDVGGIEIIEEFVQILLLLEIVTELFQGSLDGDRLSRLGLEEASVFREMAVSGSLAGTDPRESS